MTIFLYNGKTHIWKDGLYIEMDPDFNIRTGP